MENIHKKQSTWCHMQLVKSSSPTKRQGQRELEMKVTRHKTPNLWWIHTSSMWKLTLERVFSLACQFTIKPWQRLGPRGCENEKKVKPKQAPHLVQALPETPWSNQFFIEKLFLTLACLALAFDIDHFRPPWVLVTYAHDVTFEAFSLLPLHFSANYILDVFKFKESLLHSFHLCLLSLHVVLSACTSLVAHQRKSILSILLWLPILTLPVSGTAVRQLSPFPCWWQGFVFFLPLGKADSNIFWSVYSNWDKLISVDSSSFHLIPLKMFFVGWMFHCVKSSLSHHDQHSTAWPAKIVTHSTTLRPRQLSHSHCMRVLQNKLLTTIPSKKYIQCPGKGKSSSKETFVCDKHGIEQRFLLKMMIFPFHKVRCWYSSIF